MPPTITQGCSAYSSYEYLSAVESCGTVLVDIKVEATIGSSKEGFIPTSSAPRQATSRAQCEAGTTKTRYLPTYID